MKNLQLPLLIWLVCLLATALPPAGAQVPAVRAAASEPGERVALLIGNSKYKGGQPGAKPNDWRQLENAARDAQDIKNELIALGFLDKDVELLMDATQLEILKALERLRKRSGNAKQVVVYFAGHGVQAETINYMIPVDAHARDNQLASLQARAIPLKTILDSVEQVPGLKVVMIDACRTAEGYGRGESGGLAHPEATKKLPAQTVVVFAADVNQVANDSGPGQRNGYFAQGLLQALRGPDLNLRNVILQTEIAVAKSSEERQQVRAYGGERVKEHFKFGPTKTQPPNIDPQLAELQKKYDELVRQSQTAAAPATAEKLPELELLPGGVAREITKPADKYISVIPELDGFGVQYRGATATDTKTGLEWRRCSLGQNWNGNTCKGQAKTFTFAQVQQATKNLNALGSIDEPSDWRLPTTRELFGLVRCDKGIGKNIADIKDGGAVLKDGCLGEGYARPTIAQRVFPNTPAGWFWTSTPLVGDPDYVWNVYFYDGGVYYGGHKGSYHVRLVRRSRFGGI